MKNIMKEIVVSLGALAYGFGTIVFFLILARKCGVREFLLGLFLYLINTIMLYRGMTGRDYKNETDLRGGN